MSLFLSWSVIVALAGAECLDILEAFKATLAVFVPVACVAKPRPSFLDCRIVRIGVGCCDGEFATDIVGMVLLSQALLLVFVVLMHILIPIPFTVSHALFARFLRVGCFLAVNCLVILAIFLALLALDVTVLALTLAAQDSAFLLVVV
jgi:hypothetical protein